MEDINAEPMARLLREYDDNHQNPIIRFKEQPRYTNIDFRATCSLTSSDLTIRLKEISTLIDDEVELAVTACALLITLDSVDDTAEEEDIPDFYFDMKSSDSESSSIKSSNASEDSSSNASYDNNDDNKSLGARLGCEVFRISVLDIAPVHLDLLLGLK